MLEFFRKQSYSTKWSAIALFHLLAALQMLRAIKDTMALEAKVSNLQYLISGTFLMIILLTLISGKTSKKGSNIQFYLSTFLSIGLLVFAFLADQIALSPAILFILIGSFSLVLISQFWKSLMAIHDFKSGVQNYGFIAILGSLGGIIGPLISILLIRYLGFTGTISVAIILLFISNLSLRKAAIDIRDGRIEKIKDQFAPKTGKPVLLISSFVFIYALLSTFIYVHQLDIVNDYTDSTNLRITLFSIRDIIIGVLLVLFQYFTIKYPRRFAQPGIKAFPMITLFLFLVISIVPTLGAIMLAIIVFRTYNYAIIRPARETYYLSTPAIGKMKNSIDSVLYRAGDLLAIWSIYLLKSINVWHWAAVILPIPIIALWFYISHKIQFQLKQTQ